MLLCPDLAPLYRRAGGGRSLGWRLWLRRTRSRPAREGRLLFGGVLPAFRGAGLGRRLLQAAQEYAAAQGWERLSAGPVLNGSESAAFLERGGAQKARRYALYEYEP